MKPIILLISVLIGFASAAERENFKTCSQSSFCRRCRGVTGASPYEVDKTSLFTDSTEISVEIVNKVNQQKFLLKVGALEGNSFHFEIDEKSPLNPRYRVTEVLQQNPSHEIIDVSTSATEITVKSKGNKAVIKLSPFQIDFYQNEVLSVSVNSKNLMRFEHLRTKPPTLDPNEDPDSWEETFRGIVDTKPNGPEAVAMDFTFPQSDVLFGIPEHADSFALRSTVGQEPYRLFNADVPFYEVDSEMNLYGSIPLIYGHGASRTAGVFWMNSADTFVDIHDTKSAHFISEAGIIDVFILLGPSPREAFSQYTKLTGVTNLPQLPTLAYHQCRWNYVSQEDVIEVVDNFDKNELQLDTIWLDIEYTDGKRYFTWDHEHFANPLQMIHNLTLTGRHLAHIIDPHIKKDNDYWFYSECSKRGYFVKNSTSDDFEGNCWPGLSSYVDFLNPEARRYYADQYLLENFPESTIDTYIWNDMNEPSVFDVAEQTMFRDNIHYEGWEHRNVHNIYGFMHTKGTFDGLMRRGNGERRPFILTRAFFAGSQRYTAVWTGDNTDRWEYLQSSIKMCLTISVSGISFCGSDVGGFFGDPEEELFVRWYQAAAYQPFFRSHANDVSKRREPYLLPEAARNIVREAIRKRYALLPLWYTMFYEHEHDGLPLMRPMLTEYPLDKNTYKMDDQYMLSDKLLVRPVMEKDARTVNVYFPSIDGANKSEIWFDTDNYKKFAKVGVEAVEVDSMKIPVYQRGGSIIPKKETIRRSSVYMRNDPISLFVAVDAENQATGTLYIDDELSYDYRRGKYLYLHFHFANNTLTSRKVDSNADYSTGSQLGRVLIAGIEKAPKKATLESSAGESKEIEVVEDESGNFFTIEGLNVNMKDEWTIVLSGAKENFICAGLLIASLLVNLIKLL